MRAITSDSKNHLYAGRMKFNNQHVTIHPTAEIGANVRIGDNTIIYPNVVIGDNCTIANNCVIGEPLSAYYDDASYVNPKTVIGSDSLIRSHSIVYASVKIGARFSCGHRATIRELTEIGNDCRVGSFADVQDRVLIGNSCWFHSNVFISAGAEIADFVFLYPGVMLANDLFPPSQNLQGVKIEEYVQIGMGSTLLPKIVIGRHSLVGAHSLVSEDVQAFSCTVGNPAKHVKDVREIKLEDGSSAYPWPYRFDRGMPWEGMDFDEWQATR